MTIKEPESEMARCRRVREELDRRFKTLDALWRFLDEEERRETRTRGRKQGRAPQPLHARAKAS